MSINSVAGRVLKPESIEIALWTTADIGAYLKASTNKVVERYASLPGFTKRINLPKSGGGVTHPRWKARDVVQWAEGYAE